MTPFAQVRDPWESYDSVAKKPDHPPHPRVPESGSYGIVLIFLMGVLAIWAKRRR